MDKLKVSLSFRRQFKHVYEHLLGQPNRSSYVCGLIEADLNRKGKLSEEEIRRVVMEILRDQGKGPLGVEITDYDQVDHSDIDLINQLF